MVAAVSKVGEVRKTGRPKGTPRTGGRVKGTPNKNTTALKDMILAALDGAGGIEYLKAQAIETPAAFMTLVGKVLPLQLTGGGETGNPVVIDLTGLSVAALREVAALKVEG